MNQSGEDDDDGQDLARHVRDFMAFMAHKPTCQYFAETLDDEDRQNAAEAAKFLPTHLLPGGRQAFWCCTTKR